MTEAMLEKSQATARQLGLDQVEFREGLAEVSTARWDHDARNYRSSTAPDEETLRGEIVALEAERNQAGATINWRFSTEDARLKMHHLYPANN